MFTLHEGVVVLRRAANRQLN